MSRRTIEFYADEDRDWLFHCHLLYHMASGMARVMSYPAGEEQAALDAASATRGASKNTPSPTTSTTTGGAKTTEEKTASYRPSLGEHAMPHTYTWIDGSVQSHMSTGLGTVQRGRDNVNLLWEAGWERVERTEYEIDATYSRYFNPRWTAFAGYRLTNNKGGADTAIAGATYRLPYLIDATTTIQGNGEARLAVGKILRLTTRFGILAQVDYDTAQDLSWRSAITYTLTKEFSLIAAYDSDYGPGAGISFRF
jgi:hypothetical protein